MSRKYFSIVCSKAKHTKIKLFSDYYEEIKAYKNIVACSSLSRYLSDHNKDKNKSNEEASDCTEKRGLENKRFMDMRLNEMNSDAERDWYPHKFGYTMTVQDFNKKFSNINDLDQVSHADIRLCGRITRIRKQGKKLNFIDIQQDESIIQVKTSANAYLGDFMKDMEIIKRGDIIGVEGSPTVTKSGELSLLSKSMTMLSPTLKLIPGQAIVDTDLRQRKRHLDLLTNSERRGVFRIRARVISEIRSYLDHQGFLEVETPILTDGIGGANAAAFNTYHNVLDMKMSLRIAPELHLKTLVVGGYDRVYEIGKQFRNEGIDPTHNPEFTSCEFYMAYADYVDLMAITKNLLSQTAGKALSVQSTSDLNVNDRLCAAFIDKSYEEVEFIPALEIATGAKFPDAAELTDDSDEAVKFLISLCEKSGTNINERKTSKLLDKLFSKLIEPELKLPTFVLHHPSSMCPLAKEHRSIKGISERFELFAGGIELVNAYTELNDPVEQQKQFIKQKQSKKMSLEDCNIEKEFVDALEYGLPPTAGWGLGLDRFVMLLTKQSSIREVLLFPTMRKI